MIESKVVMKEEVEKDEYPKLMISEAGRIVLFTDYEEGMCLVFGSNPSARIGEYSDEWSMGAFKPFHGTITLTNK